MSKENGRTPASKKCDDKSFSHEVMQPKWTKLEYVWQINNFWEVRALASIEALDSDTADVIWSQRFGDVKNGVWRLKCYPYGDKSKAGQSNVSLFLSLDTDLHPTMKTYAIFGCSILDGNGDKVPGSGRSYTRQNFNIESNSWGWSSFIKADGHSLSRMLANDQALVLRCEIDVFLGMDRCPGVDSGIPRSLASDVIDYASQRENCDVEVQFGKDRQQSYQANSFLLKARCSYFRDLLNGKIKPETAVEYQTNGTDAEFDEDEFTSIDDDSGVKDGALYQASKTLSSKSIKRIPPTTMNDVMNCVVDTSRHVATMSRDENGSIVIVIDSVFDDDIVLAMLTHCHVGENAFTSKVQFPSMSSSMMQIAQLVQLAKLVGFNALYTECLNNMSGRMICKEDAIIACIMGRKLGCKNLENHARLIVTDCHRHSDKDELIKLILPPAALENFTMP